MPSRTVVYSCTFADYDFAFGPFHRTAGADFLRFGDARMSVGEWSRQPLPEVAARQPSKALANRYLKMFPGRIFPEAEIAIYVDGNIAIRSDLAPLISEFEASGADIALFPHPGGYSLNDEMNFALKIGRVRPEQREAAERQRARYRELGLLESKLTENSIIFYRITEALDDFGESWWQETIAFAHRDQFSLPFVLSEVPINVHYWPWHFQYTPNTYFDRYPHRTLGGRRDRARAALQFMWKHRRDYPLWKYVLNPP
jgi:hypothetical protein